MENKLNKGYRPPNKSLWRGRVTKPELGVQFWYQAVELINAEDLNSSLLSDESIIGIIGYVCDEGVRRNFGRVGALEGATVIRERLAKIPFHLSNKRIADVGDVVCLNGAMEDCQLRFSNVITNMISNGVFPIALGGGHDIAYGHFKGIWNAVKNTSKNKIGIVNFDAHFDLRPVEQQSNSGTPFNQITSEFKENVNYLAIGIQQQSNTKELFDIAKNRNVSYINSVDCELSNITSIYAQLEAFVSQNDWIYITIDMDGFSSAYAPGVSAPSPLGFSPSFVMQVLIYLLETKKVISCDIAELNPNYDRDNSTAILAARLLEFIALNH